MFIVSKNDLPLVFFLTLIPPIATIVSYANSLDLAETSASRQDPSYLTFGQYFTNFEDFEVHVHRNIQQVGN